MADALVATLEADIATLEGGNVGGMLTQCSRVREVQVQKRDQNGEPLGPPKRACQCAAYRPKSSGLPTFKELCRSANLPVIVGGKNFYNDQGEREMSTALALPPPMDFAPMDGYDDGMGFFESVLDPAMLKDLGAAAGGGMLGGVAYDYLSTLDFFDKPYKTLLLAVGLGLAGGRALWGNPFDVPTEHQEMRRSMAKGHVGAMGHVIGKQIYEWLMNKKPATAPAGLRGSSRPAFQPFSSRHMLSDSEVITNNPAFADADVESEGALAADVSAWIGG